MLTFNFEPFPVIETERLTLREVTMDDAAAVFAHRSNPEIWKYVDRPVSKSIEEAKNWITTIRKNRIDCAGINWVITLKGQTEAIGNIGFWPLDADNYRAEIGYLLQPDQQGKGLMQEALSAVINYGFATMGLHSIEANVNPGNAASIKLLEKNGFVREAYFGENCFFNGKFHDTAIYSLIATTAY